MKIRVHYPATEKGKKELQERIDQVHADIIIGRINALDCSYERKVKLLADIREEFEKRGEEESEFENCV